MFKELFLLGVYSLAFSSALLADSTIPATLEIQIKEEFANQLLEKNWSESQPIQEYQLGAWVQGQATTNAHENVRFLNSPLAAHLEFTIVGSTLTKTKATQKPATVYSSTVTNFHTTKGVLIPDKTPLLYPAYTKARSKATIQSIYVDVRPVLRRLVSKIAWRRARAMLPVAEKNVSNEIIKRVNRQFDEMLAEEIKKITKSPVSYLTERFERYFQVPSLKSKTQDQVLFLEAYYPPYRSFVPYLSREGASARLTSTFLSHLLSSLKGQTIEVGYEDAKITLSETVGPQVFFQEQRLLLEFLSKSLEISGDTYPERKIRMLYQITKEESQWVIEKKEKAIVLPLSAQSEATLTEEDKKIATIYRHVLEGVLPDYIPIGNYEIKNANGKLVRLKLNHLRVTEPEMKFALDIQ